MKDKLFMDHKMCVYVLEAMTVKFGGKYKNSCTFLAGDIYKMLLLLAVFPFYLFNFYRYSPIIIT